MSLADLLPDLDRRLAERLDATLTTFEDAVRAHLHEQHERTVATLAALRPGQLPGLSAEDVAPLGTSVGHEARSRGFTELLAATRALDAADDQVELLCRLLEQSAAFCSRAVLLIVQENGATGWAGRGFGEGVRPLEGVEVPWTDAWAPFATGSGVVTLSDSGASVCAQLGAEGNAAAVAIPMVIQDRVAAALYADADSAATLATPALQLLVHLAAARLEGLGAGQRTPTLHDASVGAAGIALGLVGAAAERAGEPPAVFDREVVDEVTDVQPLVSGTGWGGVVAGGVGEEAATSDEQAVAAEAHEAVGESLAAEAAEDLWSPEEEVEAAAPEAVFAPEPAFEPDAGFEPGPLLDPEVDSAQGFAAANEPLEVEALDVEAEAAAALPEPFWSSAAEAPVEESVDLADAPADHSPAEFAASPSHQFEVEPAAEEEVFAEVEPEPALVSAAEIEELGSLPEVTPLADVEPEEVPPFETGAEAAVVEAGVVEAGVVEAGVVEEVSGPFESVDATVAVSQSLLRQYAMSQGTADATPSGAVTGQVEIPAPALEVPEAASAMEHEVDAEDETVMLRRPAPPVSDPEDETNPTINKPSSGNAEIRSQGGMVVAPTDLTGPGWAFRAGRTAEVATDPVLEEARRLARLLVSEIKLYNEEQVEEGRRRRDLYARLRDDIDRSREVYESRVNRKALEHDFFREALVRVLAGGDSSVLGV